MGIDELEQSKQLGSACKGGDSLLPTPLLVPSTAMIRQSNTGRVERPVEERKAPQAPQEKKALTPHEDVGSDRGISSNPRPGAVMRTSTPQEGAPVMKSTVAVPGKVLSSSLPANKTVGQRVSEGANRSARSLPALPEGMDAVGVLLQTRAPDGVAVPTRRSSEERRMARGVQLETQSQEVVGTNNGRTQAPTDSMTGWHGPPSRQTPARSASGSLADATDKELHIVNDLDDEEAADEENDDEEEEDCQSERSAGRLRQQSTTDTRKKEVTQQEDVEVPGPASAQKTHQVNTARIAEMSEEEERLSDYLIEAHAMELEPQAWRQTLSNEGSAEQRMKFYKELDKNLEDRRRIERLQHLILEIGEPYTKYTRVNEVMLKLRGMRRADDEIWQNLVKCREKCLIAKAYAAHGSGYHSMHFFLPEKFGTKSYIDVDRPLSRLQGCTDKNKHQIRTWMEKLFHTTAPWDMSEQAYHKAIMNMMEGDVAEGSLAPGHH